jgi:hypothetical protein
LTAAIGGAVGQEHIAPSHDVKVLTPIYKKRLQIEHLNLMRTALLVLATIALLQTSSAQANNDKSVSKALFDGQLLELRIHPSKPR